MEKRMTKLPEKNLLQGTKEPETTIGEFRLAMGNLRQFIADLLGFDSSDKQAARDTLGVQEKYLATAEGTADAMTARFASPVLKPLHGMTVQVRSQTANTTATPTFKADETGAYPIVKGNNQLLQAGDIAGDGHWLDMKFDDTLKKWVLQNPAYAISVMPEIAPVLAEKADRWDLENYLEKNGGTISGELNVEAGHKINLQSNLAIGRAYLHKYDDTTWLVNTNSANETSAYISLSDNGTIELNGKVTFNEKPTSVIVETFNNGTNWWRKWSDGWLEQGGIGSIGARNTTVITFPLMFGHEPHISVTGTNHTGGTNFAACIAAHSRGRVNFTAIQASEDGSAYWTNFFWQACGYAEY